MKECRRMKNRWSLVLKSRQLFILVLLLAGTINGSAQKKSSYYIDTTNIDTSAAVASTERETHADDTTQNFFNWKESINQHYTQSRIGSRVHADTEVNKLKKEDDFWYIKSIEKFKSSPQAVVYSKAQKDSLARKRKEDI